MAKKTKELSIEELTKQEISAIDSGNKIQKLEKESVKNSKIIDEYKEREKASARALVIFERKIKFMKESVIDELLNLAKRVDALQKTEYSQTTLVAELFDIEQKIYDVCNNTERSSTMSQQDRDFIFNKKVEQSTFASTTERYNRLKQEFAEKIGGSVNRKPGRPKKSEQSIVADIGLGKKLEKKVSQKQDTQDRLNDIFYNAPSAKSVASAIPQTDDSIFDFNEALNPNISLKDIMADLMSGGDDDIITYGDDD